MKTSGVEKKEEDIKWDEIDIDKVMQEQEDAEREVRDNIKGVTDIGDIRKIAGLIQQKNYLAKEVERLKGEVERLKISDEDKRYMEIGRKIVKAEGRGRRDNKDLSDELVKKLFEEHGKPYRVHKALVGLGIECTLQTVINRINRIRNKE